MNASELNETGLCCEPTLRASGHRGNVFSTSHQRGYCLEQGAELTQQSLVLAADVIKHRARSRDTGLGRTVQRTVVCGINLTQSGLLALELCDEIVQRRRRDALAACSGVSKTTGDTVAVLIAHFLKLEVTTSENSISARCGRMRRGVRKAAAGRLSA